MPETGPHPQTPDEPLDRAFSATPDSRPVRAAGVKEYPLGNEVLLFAGGRQVVHALNASAWAVWDLCDGSRTVRDIAAELGELVGRETGSLVAEVIRAVEDLGKLGLLEERDTGI
jgi:hypothetical protein